MTAIKGKMGHNCVYDVNSDGIALKTDVVVITEEAWKTLHVLALAHGLDVKDDGSAESIHK